MTIRLYIRRSLPHVVVAALSVVALAVIVLAHIRSPSVMSHIGDLFVNSLHGPGFTAVSVFVLSVLRVYRRSNTNYLVAAVISGAVAVLSEAVQIPGPRDASISDLVLDGLGIIGGLGMFAIFDRKLRLRLADWLFFMASAACILALLVTLVPTLLLGYGAVAQYRAMPQILTFEKSWEKAMYRQSWRHRPSLLTAPPGWPAGSDTVAYAEETGRWGSLIHLDVHPDWSGYSTFSFVAASGNEFTHEMVVSIRDMTPGGSRIRNHYTKVFQIDPKPRRYIVSLDEVRKTSSGRPFDLDRINSVDLHASSPGSGVTVYLDDFRLD